MNPSGKGSGLAVLRGSTLVLGAAVVILIMGAQAQAQSLMTQHTRPAVTSGQAKFLNRMPETQTLRIDVVLPLRDPAGLEKFLQEIYDPTSPSYRHFLTVPEFTARFGPSKEDYETVISFAKSYGFKVVGGSRDGMDVQLEGSVTSIQLAFNVSMGIYQHPTEDRTFYAPDREPTVSLPFQLWHISGLDNYSIPHPASLHRITAEKPNATTGSGPSASFLGSDMRAAYYGGTALTGAGQNLGLLEYLGTDMADLNTYFKNVGQTNNVPITLLSTDGTSTSCSYPSCDDTEQTIDMTQALGMAPGLASLTMYIGSTDTAMISAMTTHNPLPTTISCSWGWTPADASTLDPYFERMSAQGQNFFAASGDSSTWSSRNEAWPADDANIVSVGGTDLSTASAGGAWSSETAWSDSGGGISPDKIAIPAWQKLAGVINSSNKGSTTYRNGPDVSANANFTYYVCADQTTCTANEYGGTSFAAPLWAAYIALANQQALLNGATSTVGFINPTLYSIGSTGGANYAADFHDITSGKSGSYSAVTGYDLVTGWGSMNGTALITALTGPPTPNFTISASPNSVTVIQGNNGTSTISTTAVNGFDSAIGLSATGLPANVTAGFSNSGSIAAPGTGTSLLTLTVASNATPGTYPITITGTQTTGGTTANSTTVTLTVTAPNFTISASPASVSVVQGNAGTSTISTAIVNGLNSTITLSATGLPANVTAGFGVNPIAAPGTGTSLVTFTVASNATPGTYPISITGTATGPNGPITNSTSVSLTVAAPNFGISASPSPVSVGRSSSVTTTVTTTIPSGFNSAIALTATGMPSGVTATFSPTSIAAPGNGTSTLKFTTNSRPRTGTYTITIKGTGGGDTNTTTVTLDVT
jgi:kumamolisin